MKVSATQPFQIIYSLFQHEYLGFIFESFIIHLDEKGRLTFQHQNISSKNAREFSRRLDDRDFELIELMDEMGQNAVIKYFSKKIVKPGEFFAKIYHKEKGEVAVQEQIEAYVERRRALILEKLSGKMVYEMGNDGEPAWRKLEVLPHKAVIQFHFVRKADSTEYYPTLSYEGKKIELPNTTAYLVCKDPAWVVVNGKLFSFEGHVDGKKLTPFFTKKSVIIPKNIEETYYDRFVAPLIASFDNIEVNGFDIVRHDFAPHPLLTLSELPTVNATTTPELFDSAGSTTPNEDETGKIIFHLSFKYGKYKLRGDSPGPVSVKMEKEGNAYIFHRIVRSLEDEKKFALTLVKLGLPLRGFKTALDKGQAFSWLNENRVNLLNLGFEVTQPDNKDKKYFVGKAVIELDVRETIDWFDIHAKILFGEYEIPFKELRKLILRKKVEFKLPNGEIAIIPEAWLTKYSDLFALSETSGKNEKPVLKKHHFALLRELEESNLAKVHMSEKLHKLDNFAGIKNYPLPAGFLGELRPYQKAGYNWLRFLNEYRLGGCLADDMGLGKTVQTLALLQAEKEKNPDVSTSLLIMPTSLVYNWEMEAIKFTPDMKILSYTGTHRKKDVAEFKKYDLVLTSYGITRLDVEHLRQFHFNYIILDESQVIKNPTSNIAKAVTQLKSRHRLTLTGTPLENTTLDLWSQMTFINPGLLGSQTFFKNEYQVPIEKRSDESRTKKLNAVIRPFILRRLKAQVATDLPEKVENIYYTNMTPAQEERYDEVKSYYRNKIMDLIEREGINNSRLTILEGLTRLRQLSNHPRMIDPAYTGDSGKLNDVAHMIDNALLEGHKLLIFSQFVKHLAIIRDLLQARKIPFAYMDGSTGDRKEQVNAFNTDPAIKIFLISIKAGGLGLNLTEADYVFILDPWWNPAVEAQAVDRAHRIGQKKKVFTYKFITRNTVEEKILTLQKHKLKLSDNLISSEDTVVKALTKEDIEMLMA